MPWFVLIFGLALSQNFFSRSVLAFGNMNSLSTMWGFEGESAYFAVCAIETETRRPVCQGKIETESAEVAGTKLMAISGGAHFTCGLTYINQNPICWGKKDREEVIKAISIPLPYQSMKYAMINAGIWHVCAVRENASGGIDCWGNLVPGQGDPPQEIPMESITAGMAVTYGLGKNDSRVQSWGLQPRVPPGSAQAQDPRAQYSAIFAGMFHACGIEKDTKRMLCWGLNDDHQCDPPAYYNFSSIAAGRNHTCGLRDDTSEVICWGSNTLQQLDAPKGTHFSAISAADFYSCGFTLGGKPTCWGAVSNRSETPFSGKKSTISIATLAVIVFCILILVASAAAIAIFLFRRRRKRNPPWNACSLQNRIEEYTGLQLNLATSHYSETNLLGKGASSSVYKGVLEDGRVVAIKKSTSPERAKFFDQELQLLRDLNHLCLVNLVGYCRYENILIFEFMENGSLFDCLHLKRSSHLDWRTRIKIATQTSRGLEYLHTYACPPIIHRMLSLPMSYWINIGMPMWQILGSPYMDLMTVGHTLATCQSWELLAMWILNITPISSSLPKVMFIVLGFYSWS